MYILKNSIILVLKYENFIYQSLIAFENKIFRNENECVSVQFFKKVSKHQANLGSGHKQITNLINRNIF